MRVDDLDAPCGEFVASALFHVASRGTHWVFPVIACISDPVAASVFTVHTVPLRTSVDGTNQDQHAVSSALPSALLDDNTPHPSSVTAPTPSTVVLDEDALGAIPPGLPVHKDPVARQMDSDPQAPSAMPHSDSRVAGNNRGQVPVVPAAPPLLSSPSQTARPPLLPSGLISSRTCRRRATTAGKPQAAVDYGFNRSDPTQRPAPAARKPRPPRSAPTSQAAPEPCVDPVPAVPIQHATDAAASPPSPLLSALPPQTPRRVSTLAALPEMPSPAEVVCLESVERFSHTDWAREQRAEPVCDATIPCLLLGRPSVLPDDLLFHLAPHKRPPLSDVRSLAEKGRLYKDDDGILLLVQKVTPPTPVCPDKPGGRAAHLLHDEPTRIYVPRVMRPWIMQACHANTFCHLGVAHTLFMLERF